MKYFIKKIIIALYAVISLSSYNVMASNDDYLKMLESEAADTKIDRDEKREIKSVTTVVAGNIVKNNWEGKCSYADDNVPSELVMGEFSSYLKQCAMGTYIFYRGLDLKSKKSVYDNYKKSASVKLPVLRKDVLKYF